MLSLCFIFCCKVFVLDESHLMWNGCKVDRPHLLIHLRKELQELGKIEGHRLTSQNLRLTATRKCISHHTSSHRRNSRFSWNFKTVSLLFMLETKKKNSGRLNVQNHSGLNGSQGSGEKLRKPGCVEVLFCNSLTAHTSANPAASCELPQKKTLISSS